MHPVDESLPQVSTRKLSIGWIAVPLLLVLLAAVALRGSRSFSSVQDSPAIGKPAPRLDLVRLTNDPVLDRLQRISPGKVTLIHFWGTWCGPCKMEYPQLSEVANHLQLRSGFDFISVSCESGRGETFDGLRKKTDDYFASQGLPGVAFADPQGITRRSVAERLGRRAMFYPTSILVGADGKIAGVWEGYTPESVEEIEAHVDRLLRHSGGAS